MADTEKNVHARQFTNWQEGISETYVVPGVSGSVLLSALQLKLNFLRRHRDAMCSLRSTSESGQLTGSGNTSDSGLPIVVPVAKS